MTSRSHAATAAEAVVALVEAPYVTGLVAVEHGSRIGRPRRHPEWVCYAYSALSRHFRSANHCDAELRSGLWDTLRTEAVGVGLADPGEVPFTYHHYTYWRDRLVGDPENRERLADRFTRTALGHAHALGLLVPGAGSRTYPSADRTIYGDGTVIRPKWNAGNRTDPSAADHHRFDGAINGNNYVTFSARADQPHGRVVLAIDRVPEPGGEAATAVSLIGHILARSPDDGIQAVVYDGAFQGAHIDRIMRTTGLVVANKVAAAGRNDNGDILPKRRPLGTHTHEVRNGRKTCRHTLHAVDGSIVDVAIADDGTPTDVATVTRKQVKRSRRQDGTYRFHLAVTVPCPNGEFTVWLSPHADGNRDTTPEHVRLIPPADPHFTVLYGRRNDAESFNAQLKRTLLADRASAVGWERQLFDLYGFAVLHNSINWLRQQTALAAAA